VIVEYAYELALLDLGDGDRTAARAALAAALAAAPEPAPKRVALARVFKQIIDGDAAARDELARLATPPKPDAPWYALVIPADAELARALAGDASAAARAVSYFERIGANRSPLVAQRLAWAKSLTVRSESVAAPEPTSP
jgi:hypothetical protein